MPTRQTANHNLIGAMTNTSELWIASNNAKKRRELERLFAPLDVNLHTPAELDVEFDPTEDQPDFAGNATIKARALAELVGAVTIADDSGLCVDALGGRPGVFSARYGGPGLDDRGRLEHLLAEMQGVATADRAAHFRCCICLCGPDGQTRLIVEERCEGMLLEHPRGDHGFGYDPIFVAQDCLHEQPVRSFAEVDAARKDEISHRGKALRALIAKIESDPSLLAS